MMSKFTRTPVLSHNTYFTGTEDVTDPGKNVM